MVTEANGSTVFARAGRGCPQGGVLSPLLWTLVVDGLLKELVDEGLVVQGYADDVSFSVRGKHPLLLAKRMQTALTLTQDWCLNHNLRVNLSKTEMVLFTRKRRFNFKAPSIFGTELQISDEVRYLGVILDKRLTWKRHVARLSQKAINTYWACKSMFARTWGLKPHVVKRIYTAIMIPQMTYAFLVWWTSMEKTTHRRLMGRAYRLALMGITGAFHTTPTPALGVLLNIAPPHIVAMTLARNSALRLHLGNRWTKSRYGHSTLLDAHDLQWIMLRGGDRCDWESSAGELLSSQGLVWFTDGSKNGTGAGAGVCGVSPRISLSLALGDSRAAIRSLGKVVTRSKLVRDCVTAITELAEHNHVSLLWVSGHSGIKGNEEANRLAREGTRCHSGTIHRPLKLASSVIKNWNKEWVSNQFDHLWKSESGMRYTKALVEGPDKDLANKLCHMDRQKVRRLVGIITGHWYTGKHLAKLGIQMDSNCPRCGEEDETPLHVLRHCKGTEALRSKFDGLLNQGVLRLKADGVVALLDFARETTLLERLI
ncbi:uncharacterized protein LOC143211596 [Lasioglossum baleicum]|uniref:uncharacterized protein LOC143211596 n=1 Tax=Lasioglossum baleicum TaxID=434251 RepID=UPI003FCCAB4A